jgi:OFA family oxalate/formate antiporter-like MFS transporter
MRVAIIESRQAITRSDRERPFSMQTNRSGSQRKKPVIGPFRAQWPLAFRVQQLSQYGLENSIPINKEADMSKQNVSAKRGWTVVMAGTGINLALGILYTWSIFKGAIAESINV